jgi:hypothetical protein
VQPYYILDENRNAVPADSIEEWGRWFEGANRRVRGAQIEAGALKIVVSTVFLGIDHGWGGSVLLFETMVFGEVEGYEEECWRYGTWDEAVEGHEKVVEMICKVLTDASVLQIPENVLGKSGELIEGG